MSRIGDELVVTISGDSNVADGVAHPWERGEHVHVRSDSGTTFSDEKYRIEIVEKRDTYWIGKITENIDVRTTNEEINTSGDSSTKIYWIKTGKSYCYHTDPNCVRLEKHAGERFSSHINRQKGKIPDPIKQRRPCPDCI